jgi:hypothetical protein
MNPRRDSGGVFGGAFYRDRMLTVARRMANKDWENPKDIQRARHMAHDGASVQEIADALQWGVTWYTADKRLKKYNIRPIGNKRAHRGIETTLPYDTGFEVYRPRTLERAE